MKELAVGQRITAHVDKVVYGGKGLIRFEGWVLFVDEVAAGEEVEVEITQKKSSYCQARLLHVIQPSKEREEPPCPYFGTCGGCQLQHLAYQEQLRLKKEWLEEAFLRIAKIPIDFPISCQKAASPWGYRRKVTLHATADGKMAGFYAKDNQTIIPINRCLIFSEKYFDKVPKSCMRGGSCTVIRESNDRFRYGSHQVIVEELAGLVIEYSSSVFTQNDPKQAVEIYRDILAKIQTETLLDLYCGIGLLSLLAASSGKKVAGVELNAQAIAFAKKNAQVNRISGIEFFAHPCEEIHKLSSKGLEPEEFRTWLVNPPRVGLSREVKAIVAKYVPKQLIYMSCQPATLARDVKELYEMGYRIEEARVYDMFAQTTHLETVVYLSKT